MFKSKRGQVTISRLVPIVSLLIVAGLIATFAVDITDDIQEDFRAGDAGTGCGTDEGNCTGAAFNTSGNTLTAVTNITGQFGNAGTVIGAGLIIGILLTAFAINRGGVSFR